MANYPSPLATLEKAGAAPIGGGHGLAGTVKFKRATITLGTAPAQNDTLEFFTMPRGAVFLDAYLDASDLDTNVTPTATLDIGDADNVDRMFDGSIGLRTGVKDRTWVNTTMRGYKYTADTMVTGLFAAAVATGATGSVTLMVMYFQEDFATS